MKVYTKTGDKGKTALIGGKRVSKSHQRIEAYGTVDELIAYMAVIRDLNIDLSTVQKIIEIQDNLMIIASVLATDCDDCEVLVPELKVDAVNMLEKEIDLMDETLPALTSFILPGGDISSSYCHVARTVCRRAERIIIALSQQHEVPDVVIKYVNRLSDYLFTLARKFVYDNNKKETVWKSVR